MTGMFRTLAILGAICIACAAVAAPLPQQVNSTNGVEQVASRDRVITPAMTAAINAHTAKANRIAQQIRENSAGMSDASYTNLSVALLGASEAGLDAAASARSYRDAITAIRSAEQDAAQRVKARPARNAGSGTEEFGSNLTSEFVFYPIVPCRLLDTREGGTRLQVLVPYLVDFDGGNFGNAAGCTRSGVAAQLGGITAGLERAAMVINLTATGSTINGWIQARPVGSTSFTSNQNFYPGQNIANMVVVPNSGTSNADFELRASNETHAVVDVLGVFAPPMASALDCVYTTIAGTGTNNVPDGSEFAFSTPAACPTGYTLTSISCEYALASPAGLTLTQIGSLNAGGWFPCKWRNETGGFLNGASFNTQSRCCQIPGRK